MHDHSKRFMEIIDGMRNLHLKKAADYGSENSPLRNIFVSAAENNVHPLTAINIRRSDKKARILRFMETGELENESIYDAYLDEACYDVLALIVLQLEEEGVLGEAIEAAVLSSNNLDQCECDLDYGLYSERCETVGSGDPEEETDCQSCTSDDLQRLVDAISGYTSSPVEGQPESPCPTPDQIFFIHY